MHDAMDELLLSKVRLGIVAALLASEWMSFAALAEVVQATGGNLGAHLAKLVDGGYVEEEKLFVARRPQTRYRLTRRGRDAFLAHIKKLQSFLKGAS
jgi:predicted ArsR family transcriptional regulator